MKVWVIVSDIGLNGTWVHGVRSEEPTPQAITEFVNSEQRNPDGSRYRVASTTGYAWTEAIEMEVDMPWR